MRARVCKAWRDAAKKTIVPIDVVEEAFFTEYGFKVNGLMSYYAMTVMTTALPCLQQLKIGYLGHRRTFLVGEDPDEERATQTANDTMYDINLLSNFSKLRTLRLDSRDLNGRYPVLFNFPVLRKLTITSNCEYLKWNLEMLSGCPLLEELSCYSDEDEPQPSGNLSSLGVLKNTLQKVELSNCSHIHGNLMDLADFPHLKELELWSTAVTGDIRHIDEDDFPSIEVLRLPSTVIGGMGYRFERISDVPSFMHAIYPLLQRRSTEHWNDYMGTALFEWALSENSPDWYWPDEESDNPSPPFWLRFFRAGPCLGWCWSTESYSTGHFYSTRDRHYCRINWLDSAPRRGSGDYKIFIKEFERIKRNYGSCFRTFRGYRHPPTEEEYRRLFEE